MAHAPQHGIGLADPPDEEQHQDHIGETHFVSDP
jgi:hypothetical protein